MRRALLAVILVLACGDTPEPKAPEYRPAHASELFVFRIVKNLQAGRIDVLTEMVTESAREEYDAASFDALRLKLDRDIGPLIEGRVLRVSVEPVMREDGTVGLFGLARAEFPQGFADLRVQMVCAPQPKDNEYCAPPYAIEAMSLEPLVKPR